MPHVGLPEPVAPRLASHCLIDSVSCINVCVSLPPILFRHRGEVARGCRVRGRALTVGQIIRRCGGKAILDFLGVRGVDGTDPGPPLPLPHSQLWLYPRPTSGVTAIGTEEGPGPRVEARRPGRPPPSQGPCKARAWQVCAGVWCTVRVTEKGPHTGNVPVRGRPRRGRRPQVPGTRLAGRFPLPWRRTAAALMGKEKGLWAGLPPASWSFGLRKVLLVVA